MSRFRSFRNVSDFAERCIELISWVHDESTARDHPYFTPFSERFVQSLEADLPLPHGGEILQRHGELLHPPAPLHPDLLPPLPRVRPCTACRCSGPWRPVPCTSTAYSSLVFTRHPFKTNFIFDEQEALLANPYVRSVVDKASPLHWLDAFRRDFWGLPPDRSIGSYRPIPDLVWRALWGMGARTQSPFLHHWVNVLLHG